MFSRRLPSSLARVVPRRRQVTAVAARASLQGPSHVFVLYTEPLGSFGTRPGRLMMHGLFSSRAKAEQAVEAVKKELDFRENDAEFAFRIEKCCPDTVYPKGVVKQRLLRASVYD